MKRFILSLFIGSMVFSFALVNIASSTSTIGANISTTGTLTVTNGGTSAVAFQNAAATTIFQFDTTNSRLGIIPGGNLDTTFEVGGLASISNASISNRFELTSTTARLGINAGGFTETMLEVGGTASISGNVTLGGTLTATSGLTSLSNASVSDRFELTSTTARLGINAGGFTETMLEVGGTASISGNVTLGGTLTATSGLTSLSNASVSDRFELTSTTARLGINAGGFTETMLEVGGTASISGNVTRGGTLTATSGLTSLSNASVSDRFELTSTTARLGINAGGFTETMLEVGGTASISGNVTLGGTLTATSGLTSLSNASVSDRFELTSTTARLGINAGGFTETMLEVGGTASISGNVTLGGTLTATSGLTSLSNASVSDRFELTSTTARLGINAGGFTETMLEVGGTASISGNVTLGGTLTATSGLTSLSNASVSDRFEL